MDVHRARFVATLMGFVLWVVSLGALVALSSREPPAPSLPALLNVGPD